MRFQSENVVFKFHQRSVDRDLVTSNQPRVKKICGGVFPITVSGMRFVFGFKPRKDQRNSIA